MNLGGRYLLQPVSWRTHCGVVVKIKDCICKYLVLCLVKMSTQYVLTITLTLYFFPTWMSCQICMSWTGEMSFLCGVNKKPDNKVSVWCFLLRFEGVSLTSTNLVCFRSKNKMLYVMHSYTRPRKIKIWNCLHWNLTGGVSTEEFLNINMNLIILM